MQRFQERSKKRFAWKPVANIEQTAANTHTSLKKKRLEENDLLRVYSFYSCLNWILERKDFLKRILEDHSGHLLESFCIIS